MAEKASEKKIKDFRAGECEKMHLIWKQEKINKLSN